jgi:Bacteriophage clamp loader A subunit
MELKDWLNSINQTKNNLIDEDPSLLKEYTPYIINRCLSGHIDTILFANEINMNSHLDKDMQYSFFLNTIRKRKRFSPWLRKDKIKDLECVKSYYGYSNEKASQALKILSKEQINFIKQRLEIGGTK